MSAEGGQTSAAPPLQNWLHRWRTQPWHLRLLRVFLGVTFVYAGWNKLADPGFFSHGSADFIGNQLAGFAQGSPIAFLLKPLAAHVPVLTGLVTALGELAIGLGTLLDVLPVLAAFGGALISLMLWLSASWHVHPYFLGSDSIYTVAWVVLGAAIAERRRAVAAAPARGAKGRTPAGAGRLVGRAELVRGGLAAAAAVVLSGVARALAWTAPAQQSAGGLSPSARSTAAGSSVNPAAAPSPTATATPSPSPSPQAAPSPPPGQVVANLSDLPVGGAVGFDGGQYGPSALLRPTSDTILAYSRVCTHAGCLVGYSSSRDLLMCPCHGAEFNPEQDGQVVRGPARRPLPSIPVAVYQPTGDIYAQTT